MLAVKQNNMGVKRKNDRYKKSIICTYKWIVYLLFIIITIFNFSNMYQQQKKTNLWCLKTHENHIPGKKFCSSVTGKKLVRKVFFISTRTLAISVTSLTEK